MSSPPSHEAHEREVVSKAADLQARPLRTEGMDRPKKPKTQAASFDVSKRNALQKLDKSPKGSVDAPIVELVGAMNGHADFVTTSSCSGRVVLFESAPQRGGRWRLVQHGTATCAEVRAAIAPGWSAGGGAPEWESSVVSLKVEPPILHVLCRDVAAAKRLLQVALRAGFRESGLVLSESTKVMLAIRTTANCLELPLAADGATLVTDAYLVWVVDHANAKFGANAKRLEGLHSGFVDSECAGRGGPACAECEGAEEPG